MNSFKNKLQVYLHKGIDTSLQIIEPLFLLNSKKSPTPPLFIVAPPRSGTTLIYQLITHSLSTSYFCNFANRFPLSPIAATALMRGQFNKYHSNFSSSYGNISERVAPSQGDKIWERWFGSSRSYYDGTDLKEVDLTMIRNIVSRLTTLIDGPFINKSISNSVRIQALNRVFPNSLFLWVKRDMTLTVQSQLSNRNRHNLTNSWVSAKPKEYEQIKHLPIVEQVCNQIFWIHHNIYSDLCTINPKRYLIINYEDVCSKPTRCIDQVRELWKNHGIIPKTRFDPPRSFCISNQIKMSTDVEKKVIDTLNLLQTTHPIKTPYDTKGSIQ